VRQGLDIEAARKIGQQPRGAGSHEESTFQAPGRNSSGDQTARDASPAGGKPRREIGNVTGPWDTQSNANPSGTIRIASKIDAGGQRISIMRGHA
jgi:hypothetical protein